MPPSHLPTSGNRALVVKVNYSGSDKFRSGPFRLPQEPLGGGYMPGGRQDWGIPRIGVPSFPMGLPGIPRIPAPRVSIPTVVPTLTLPPAGPLFRTPNFNPSVPQLTQAPVKIRPDETGGGMQNETWQEYMRRTGGLPADWNNFPMPRDWQNATRGAVSTPPNVPNVVNTQVSSPKIGKNGDSPMDLGDLLGQLGTSFINAKYGQATTAQPVAFNQAPVGVTPALGIPFVDVVPEAGSCEKGMVWNPRANCGQGKWQKRSRRRRRRIATASDIRDLIALKEGVGPAMAKSYLAKNLT